MLQRNVYILHFQIRTFICERCSNRNDRHRIMRERDITLAFFNVRNTDNRQQLKTMSLFRVFLQPQNFSRIVTASHCSACSVVSSYFCWLTKKTSAKKGTEIVFFIISTVVSIRWTKEEQKGRGSQKDDKQNGYEKRKRYRERRRLERRDKTKDQE